MSARRRRRVRVAAPTRRPEASADGSSKNYSTVRPPRAAGDPFDATLNGWHPSIGSADSDWLSSRDTAVARTRDLEYNEPWAQSAIDAKAVAAIASGWIWSSRPNAKALGLAPESDEYQALADSQEVAMSAWANDPAFRGDFHRALPFGLQLYVAASCMFRDGESVALVNYEADRTDGFDFKTSVQLIDSDRVSNPNHGHDTPTLRGGVDLDEFGRPQSINIRSAHPSDLAIGDYTAVEWEQFPFREAWGRPRAIQMFDRNRVDQHRGVSRLVASLKRFKVLQAYTEAELKTAALNATVFATIYADGVGDYLSEALGDTSTLDGLVSRQNAFYQKMDPRFAGSKAVRVFPGDRLEMHTQGRANAAFGDFTFTLLQSLAAGLGMTYEQLTKDFSRTNYSSARAAMIEAWRTVERERALIKALFADQVLLAVLEEAHDSGMIEVPRGAPDFWDAPGAYIKGRWLASGRGAIDPVKERQGARLAVENLEMTFEDIAAESGRDFDEVVASQARVLAMMEDAGLSPARLADVMQRVQQVEEPVSAPSSN